MSSPAPSAHRVQDANALPVGTRLGEFELLSLLGVGGFGIVYLAFDHALEREVAVKEYMPATLAGRTETMHVSLRSQSDAETFALGLRSFVNEARLLARFDHPSLLKVLRFWEANGTAYMAMPVMRGRTLKELRTAEGRAPDEATLRSMLADLLGALERLHGEGVYHRDIAPDNIQIEPDGHPVLLDFGAARRVLSDKTQTLTAILKPAYAPIEQYAETGSVKQGPWTDFYALGATLHYVLLGKPPAPATARAVFDESASLAGTGLPGYSAAFLQMVDWMLAPKPADRPQSVADLRQVLMGARTVPAPFMVEPASTAWDKTQILPHGLKGGDDVTLVMPRAATAPVEGAAGLAAGARQVTAPPQARAVAGAAGSVSHASVNTAAPMPPVSAPSPVPAPSAAPAATAAAARRSPLPWIVAVAAAMVVAGVVFWPKPAPAPTAAPVEAAAPGATSPAPATGSGGAAVGATSLVSAPGQTTGIAAAPVAAATTAGAAPAATAAPPAVAPQVRATPESEVRPAQPVLARTAPKPANAAPSPGGKAAQPSGLTAAPTQSPADAPSAQPMATAGPAPTVAAPAPAATTSTAADAAPSDARAAAPDVSAQAAEGPEAKCAGRNALSYFVCMERECLRSSFAAHNDCKNWRRSAKRD